LPLTVGGADTDIPLPGLTAPGPVAYLGLSDGELFVQPGSVGERVICNGLSLTTSQWLHDGDVLRIGTSEIRVAARSDGIHMLVDHGAAEDADTAPPLILAREGSAHHGAEPRGRAITPVDFRPGDPATGRPASRPFRATGVLLALGLAALSALAWWVLTVRAVQVRIEPAPDRLALEGALLALRLGDRHLLRPGTYTLVAEKAGFHRLEVGVEVTRLSDQSFSFRLERLPGRLAVSSAPVQGAAVTIDGVEVGTTPLPEIEVPPGRHQVRILADRYLDYTTEVLIDGGGAVEVLEAELTPGWASVGFSSEPQGATVRVDGESVGTTPVTADLMAGTHTVEMVLAGYRRRRSTLAVVADEPQELPPVQLKAADGRLALRSEPSAASVTVDDAFRGQTPLTLSLAPELPHQVLLAKAGYETELLTVQVRSAETTTLDVALTPKQGEIEIAAVPPDSELFVNGEHRGPANQALLLTAVPQRIEIRREGYETYRTTVTPRPGFPQSVAVTLKTLAQAREETIPRILKTFQGQELRLIDGGRLRMGASRREPGRRANETIREIELTRRFYLATTEVSNRQFREFKEDHLSGKVREHSLERDDHPAVRVTWEAAAQYCNWLSERESLPPAYVPKDGKLVASVPMTAGYRLPTEAEWTQVARYPDGKTALKYPWGNSLPVAPQSANYADASAHDLLGRSLPDYNDGFPVTAPVESFAANPLGIFNLGGNVAEWIHDFYSIHPSGDVQLERDPVGPDDGELHVIRGSSWIDSSVSELRLSYRDYGNKARPDLGFRIARYLE
jgi:formylglycine-generating enzyme required for sulfatase activity